MKPKLDPWQPGTIIVSIATQEGRSAVLVNYVGKDKEVTTIAQDVGELWPTVALVMEECPRIGKFSQLLIYTNDEEFLRVYTPPIRLTLDSAAKPVNLYHWGIGRRLFMVPRWRLLRTPVEKMVNTVRLFE